MDSLREEGHGQERKPMSRVPVASALGARVTSRTKTGPERQPMSTEGQAQTPIPLRVATVDCILSPGDVFQASLRNITLAGLQLTSPRILDKWQRVTVCVSAREPDPVRPVVVMAIYIDCEVAWCREVGGEITAGLRYLPMSTREMQHVVDFFHREYGLKLWEWPDKRETPRVSRKLVCHYYDQARQLQLAMIRDLSVTGLGLVTMAELAVGSSTRFRFGVSPHHLMERPGRVVRCRRIEKGFDVGVVFDPMDDAAREELALAVARAAEE